MLSHDRKEYRKKSILTKHVLVTVGIILLAFLCYGSFWNSAKAPLRVKKAIHHIAIGKSFWIGKTNKAPAISNNEISAIVSGEFDSALLRRAKEFLDARTFRIEGTNELSNTDLAKSNSIEELKNNFEEYKKIYEAKLNENFKNAINEDAEMEGTTDLETVFEMWIEIREWQIKNFAENLADLKKQHEIIKTKITNCNEEIERQKKEFTDFTEEIYKGQQQTFLAREGREANELERFRFAVMIQNLLTGFEAKRIRPKSDKIAEEYDVRQIEWKKDIEWFLVNDLLKGFTKGGMVQSKIKEGEWIELEFRVNFLTLEDYNNMPYEMRPSAFEADFQVLKKVLSTLLAREIAEITIDNQLGRLCMRRKGWPPLVVEGRKQKFSVTFPGDDNVPITKKKGLDQLPIEAKKLPVGIHFYLFFITYDFAINGFDGSSHMQSIEYCDCEFQIQANFKLENL